MDGQEFLKDLNKLSGITIGERRKNLQFLLQKYSQLKNSTKDLEFIVKNLVPTTHLESIFRVEILINFQCFEALFEDYKNGDDLTIKKLSKQQWFQERAFQISNPDEFVDQFLPQVSYCVRTKILKRIRADESKCGEIFDKVVGRYGLLTARNVLHKCSKEKIRNVLNKNAIKLTYRQLKVVFDKDPDLIDLYLEKLGEFENIDNVKNNPIFVYIAQKNPEYFCKLHGKYELKTKLGNRTTKKFVLKQKNRILAEPKDYIEILRKDSLVKKLGDQFKTFFNVIFPRDLNNSNILKYLQYYPKNSRFNLYKSTFNSIFSEKFDDNVKYINEEVLQLNRNHDEREKYARLKYEKDENDEYLKYYRTTNCLELIKNWLTSSNNTQRVHYVELLTYSCLINEDLDSLQIIGDLVRIRFKNEQQPLFSIFLTIIFDKEKIVDLLTEKHWEIIYDIINLPQFGYAREIYIVKMIEFYFDKTEKFEEVLMKLGYQLCERVSEESFKKYNKNPKLQRALIFGLLKISLPQMTNDNIIEICHFYLRIIQFCRLYNHNNRNDTIDIVEIVKNHKILELIKTIYNKENENSIPYNSTIIYVLFGMDHDVSSDIKAKFFKYITVILYYSKNFYKILQYDPQSLIEYFDIYIEHLFSYFVGSQRKTWQALNNYQHLGIEKKFIDYFLSFKDDNKTFRRCIRPLSILMPINDYLEFANSYKPENAKVDVCDPTIRDRFIVQSKIVIELKNSRKYELILPLVLKFCVGDYLKYALRPLYSCFYHVPEKQIQLLLEPIKNIPNISVGKHAIHLICYLSDTKTVYNNFKETSLPILGDLLTFFKNNSSPEFWELLQTNMLEIKPVDNTSLEMLTKSRIPLEYRDRYYTVLWEILTKFNKKLLKKKVLLDLHSNDVELCRHICCNFIDLQEIDRFLVDFIINNRTATSLNLIGDVLFELKTNYWNKKQENVRKRIREFIQLLFDEYLETKITDEDYFIKFSRKFSETFQIYEAFNEFVLIKLMTLKDKSMECIAKEILNLNHELLSKYRDTVLSHFVAVIKRSLAKFCETTDEQYEFCYYLFENRKSLEDDILIIELLPEVPVLTISGVERYNKIMKELEASGDDNVKLHLNLYFCNLFVNK